MNKRTKSDEDLQRHAILKAVRNRTRRRLSHRSAAFRALFIEGANNLINTALIDDLPKFGLGKDEPVYPIPAHEEFHDAYREEGNHDHWICCWSMVAIVIEAASKPKGDSDTAVQQYNRVTELVHQLEAEEWKTLRRHVLKTASSDGFTPWINKAWAQELDDLRGD